MDFSPVLLGILSTLVVLCLVIFIKVYCNRITTPPNDVHDEKHMSNINYKHDALKVNNDSLEVKLF